MSVYLNPEVPDEVKEVLANLGRVLGARSSRVSFASEQIARFLVSGKVGFSFLQRRSS